MPVFLDHAYGNSAFIYKYRVDVLSCLATKGSQTKLYTQSLKAVMYHQEQKKA